jgi:hypothetical protein
MAAEPTDEAGNLRALLLELDPKARDDLRRVLIHDQADRDGIAKELMRYRDQTGDEWADIIGFLTMHPDARRQVVRLLGKIDARGVRFSVFEELEQRMIAQLVIRILAVLQLPPYAQNVMLAT